MHVTTVPQTLGFLSAHVHYMRTRGLDFCAVASPGQRLEAFGHDEGVTTHAVQMPRAITPVRDLVALWRLVRLFRRLRPTIVHAHTPKGGLLGMLASMLAGAPLRIYHIHGLPLMTARGLRRRILTYTERISCLCAHRVLCVSPSIRRVAVELRVCPDHKIMVPARGTISGIDADVKFAPGPQAESAGAEYRAQHGIPQDALVVGYAGRIVKDKGLEPLVLAWRTLAVAYIDAHLILAGTFELQDPLSAEAQNALRTDPRIHLLGHVRDMASAYAAMDVLVLPTLREGFGNVAIEAAAMELPVVATRIPGCVDAVVDGVTGTLVPPNDDRALVEAIRDYLDDPGLRRRHGRAGRERVLRDFRPEDVCMATYKEYVRLLRSRGLPVPAPVEVTP